jgi:hypothetical protein
VRDVGKNCVDGTKFVIQQPRGTRKQFLSIEGKVVLAFVKIGNKFADCETLNEITENITCKVWQTDIGKQIFLNSIFNFQMVVGTESMNLTQHCVDSGRIMDVLTVANPGE